MEREGKGEGQKERDRNIDRLPSVMPQMGTEPTTFWWCTEQCFNQLSHSGWANSPIFEHFKVTKYFFFTPLSLKDLLTSKYHM